MTNHLLQAQVLPGLQAEDRQVIQEPFECLFSNLPGYKRSLPMNQDLPQRVESMHMMIFNGANVVQPYVAHVSLTCNSHRAAQQQFTVDAALTCQRFTHFPFQEEDFETVLHAFQNLHVQDQQDPDHQEPDQHAEWASSPEDPDDDSVFKKWIDRKLINFLGFIFSRFPLLC